MPTFTLDGRSYDYLQPRPDAVPESAHSWEYGQWPRVEATIPLVAGVGTVSVYARAMRWAGDYILVGWVADAGSHHSAWLPKDNVRRLTASEWDIIEFHRCPENLRPIRWGNRLPGFLPE
jgi:hypothetical protein